jgi:hypothetical protein
MVLISYERETRSFTGTLCSALVGGGHADKVIDCRLRAYVSICVYASVAFCAPVCLYTVLGQALCAVMHVFAPVQIRASCNKQ